MKALFKYATIALAAVSAFACNKIAEPSVALSGKEMVFIASRENLASKSFRMDDGSVWWNAAEEVSIFYGSGAAGGSRFVSTNTDIAETVELAGTITVGDTESDFWGVYPYSSENSCDGSSITTVIPARQAGVARNFSDNVFPAMAKASSTSLPFWNLCGGIKFFVSRADIKSVTFKGNNGEALAGKVKFVFGADGKPEVAEVIEGQTEVTLTAPGGGSFQAGKSYYMTLLPGALDRGFTISFQTASTIGSVTSTNPQTIKRSTFGVLNNLDTAVTDWTANMPSLRDFAAEFVKGLDVWASTTGNVDADGAHNKYGPEGSWENVHFIPIVGDPTGPYYQNGNNQYDYTLYTPWVLNVGGTEISSSQAWEIAIRGLMNMCTAEGEAFLDGMTDRNKAFTAQDGLAMSAAPVSETSPSNQWGQNPWYEYDNLVRQGDSEVLNVDIDFMLKVGAWHVVRSFIAVGANKPLGKIGNYQEFGSTSNTLNLGTYEGYISAMRELLVMMRIYKYLLDNNIDSNIYTALQGVMFDVDLYGVEQPDIRLKTKSLDFGSAEQTKDATFVAKTEWTASSTASWITVNPTSGIQGEVTIQVTAAANSGDAREGKVIIKGGNVTEGLEIAVSQAQYIAPSQSTLKDFAVEFVKGLDVWASTIGNVDADGYRNQHSNAGAWENVHFIPIVGNPAGSYYNYGNNQYDYSVYTPWVLNVGGTEISSSQAWEIAIRGLMNMCTAEGEAFLDGMTDRNKAYTLQDGLALSAAPVSATSKDNKWGNYPWYEYDNLVKDGGAEVTEVGIEFMVKVGAWHVVRSFLAVGANKPLQAIGNYQEFGTASNTLNLGNYKGFISPMRELLVMMRIYKYLLDNNIDSNVYTAIKDQKFDFDLYGIGL